MYTSHIKTNTIHSFLSLALVDAITGSEELKFSSTTSLALCLVDSLIQCYLASSESESVNEKDTLFDTRHQATQYIKWWRQGHLSPSREPGDPDKATKAALEIWEDGLERGLSTADILQHVKTEQMKDTNLSTSVLWVLPIALIFWRDRKEAAELAQRAADVLSPASSNLAGWYVNAVAAILWESAEKQSLRIGKTWLGKQFEAEYKRLGLQGTVTAEDLRKGVDIFLGTASFGEGLKAVVNSHPQTAMAYSGIAGAWYGNGVKDEIKQTVAGYNLVEKVAGRLGILAKILERKGDDEMQIIAAGVPLDDEYEGML